MSLATTLTALQNARGAIVDAIGSKGVSLPSSATLLSCADAISGIQTGTDVSSTTAEAADVLSGKVFYNSGGTQTSGTIPTVSAAVSGGSVVVPAGYIASSQTFPVSSGSGGADAVLGYVDSKGFFQPLAFSGTTAYDSGSVEVVSDYSTWNIHASESIPGSQAVYSSGGAVVSSASVMVGLAISSGGTMNIFSGGIANSTTVNGGRMVLFSGGQANRAEINSGGNVTVNTGAFVQNVTVNSGGQIMASAGVVNFTDVKPGGWFGVSSGGTASDVTISSGAIFRLWGTALDVTSQTGATVTVYEGAVITYKGGTVGLTMNRGTVSDDLSEDDPEMIEEPVEEQQEDVDE